MQLETRESQPSERDPRPRARTHFFQARYWLRDLILSVLLALIFVFFIYQPVEVEGTSMAPSLESHERIFVNKFIYRFEPIRRGDIVVFRYPLNPSKIFIKRVIGLPGDRVAIRDGRVFIDGQRLAEPYLPPSYFGEGNDATVSVPPHQYYVLGDHRDDSDDSRDWGTVERKYIYGKAVFVYWPLSQIGFLN